MRYDRVSPVFFFFPKSAVQPTGDKSLRVVRIASSLCYSE